MKVSAKAEYACLAVLELALLHGRPEPARLTEIATPNGIPERFLVQILLQLKSAGLVTSVRGPSGGYRLGREPKEISLWEVVQTVDGPAGASPSEQSCSHTAGWHILQGVWNDLNRLEQQELEKIVFSRLADRVQQQSSSMYYI